MQEVQQAEKGMMGEILATVCYVTLLIITVLLVLAAIDDDDPTAK